MLSVWDTEDDAREFEVAYRKRTSARFPGPTPPDVLVERRERRVLIVEGVPTGAALARALWR
jgi:hypothetical protein